MRIKIEIPDVATASIRSDRHLRRFFQGLGPTSKVEAALLENLVRLAESASSEYGQGADAIRTLWDESNSSGVDFSAALRSSTHFEACIVYLQRALRYVKALSVLRPLPSLVELENPVWETIRSFRNAIEHKEERILDGKISDGEYFLAYATGDEIPTSDGNSLKTIARVELGPLQIEFSVLAKAIENVRRYAEFFVQAHYGSTS